MVKRLAVYVLLACTIAAAVFVFSSYLASPPKRSVSLDQKPWQGALALAAQGKGGSQGNTAGLARLQKAAENGDKAAQYTLSIRYRHGEGVEKDFSQSGYWYRKIADQGDTEAQAFLGKSSLICSNNPHNPTHEEYCLFAAGAGDPNAQFTIGTYYDSGHYTGEDYKKAVEWFRKSAEQGHLLSQSMLGRAYEEGNQQRPGLRNVRSILRRGDVLVVWRLDRLVGTIKTLVHLLSELAEEGAAIPGEQ